MVEHVNIADGQRHEPKGISSASSGTVYVANGSGSGAWSTLSGQAVITAVIDDVSTAGTVYLPCPIAGTITQVTTVLGGAISGSDSTLTIRNSAGASAGTITVTESGSAAGDVDTVSPTTNNAVSAGSFMSIETDGASTGTAKVYVSMLVQV